MTKEDYVTTFHLSRSLSQPSEIINNIPDDLADSNG